MLSSMCHQYSNKRHQRSKLFKMQQSSNALTIRNTVLKSRDNSIRDVRDAEADSDADTDDDNLLLEQNVLPQLTTLFYKKNKRELSLNVVGKKKRPQRLLVDCSSTHFQLAKEKYKKLKKRRRRRRQRRRSVKRFNFNDLTKSVKGGLITAYNTSYNKIHGILYPDKTLHSACEEFLKNINRKLEKWYNTNTINQWNYESNLTDTHKAISIMSDIDFAMHLKESAINVKEFDKKNNCSSMDVQFRRQIKLLTTLQEVALTREEYTELQNILRDMETIFSKTHLIQFHNESKILRLEFDVAKEMASCRDSNELEYMWLSWRYETGRKIRAYYPRYVQLMNKAAKLNGLSNAADMWLSVYEADNFEETIDLVWNKVKPLYKLLHAYVRHRLKQTYGAHIVRGHMIPAHILGNIFGQTWVNIYNITAPFENESFDVTTVLQLQDYTVRKMFEEAENFFKSLNLPAMTKDFWAKSILERKRDDDNIEMVCHASAWDFYDKKDFRIKMCSHVTFEDFITIHHEMGHIEYYMLYKDQPVVFREGANPAFHEAIGDTIALSVITPTHFTSIGLLLDKQSTMDVNSYESDINFLFLMALQKIAFLPYALVVDKWRWAVFRGQITPDNYNQEWWRLSMEYQGIHPPKSAEMKNEENFDPGAKYHIAAGVPYIRYFVSFIIQFQFHEALCRQVISKEAPLHQCDIYKSYEAGKLLKQILSAGKSVSWFEIMKNFTGKNNIDAESLLKYFKPLTKWLQEENDKLNLLIDWDMQ